MAGKILILFCLFYWNNAHAAAVNIQRCKEDDGACMKESAVAFKPAFAAGIPELGVESLDPMKFKVIDASERDLKLILKDITVGGASKCNILKIKLKKKDKLQVELLCDKVDITGSYVMSGRLLVLPMEGNGALTVALKQLYIKIEADVATKTGKDGKPHWTIPNWKFDFDLRSKSNVFFDNLYPGNELLGQTARDLVKNNGNDIIFAVGRPVVKTIISKVVDNVSKLFTNLPKDDYVLPS